MLGSLDEASQLLKAAGGCGKFDMTLLDAASGEVTQAKALLLARLEKLEADVSPTARIKLAELSTAIGRENEALKLVVRAGNPGWRDTGWLGQSRYFEVLMLSEEGSQVENRIMREVESQRRFIEGSEELVTLISEP